MKKKKQAENPDVASDFFARGGSADGSLSKKDVGAGFTPALPGRDFMSDLTEIYEKAVRERDELLLKIEPFRQEETKLLAEIAPLEKRLKEIREQIVTIETPRLAELSRIISALAPKAKRLHLEPGNFGVTMK